MDDDSADVCHLIPMKKKNAKNPNSAFKGLKVFPLPSVSLNNQSGASPTLRDSSAAKPGFNLSTSQIDATSPNTVTTNILGVAHTAKPEEEIPNPHPKMFRRRFSDCCFESGGPVCKENSSIKFMVESKKLPKKSIRPDNSSESVMYDSDKAINMDASQSRVQASKAEMSNNKHNHQTPGSHFGKKNAQQLSHSQKIYPAANSKVLDSIYGFRKKNHADKMGVLNLASPFMESGHKHPPGQITSDSKHASKLAQTPAETAALQKSNAWAPCESTRTVKDPNRLKTVNFGSLSSEKDQSHLGQESVTGIKASRKQGNPFRTKADEQSDNEDLGGATKRGLESKRAKTQVKKLTIEGSDDGILDDRPDTPDTPVLARKVDSTLDIEATPPSVVQEMNSIVKMDATRNPSFQANTSERADHNFQYSDGSDNSEGGQKKKGKHRRYSRKNDDRRSSRRA